MISYDEENHKLESGGDIILQSTTNSSSSSELITSSNPIHPNQQNLREMVTLCGLPTSHIKERGVEAVLFGEVSKIGTIIDHTPSNSDRHRIANIIRLVVIDINIQFSIFFQF